MKRFLGGALGLIAMSASVGCAQYLDRKDTVAFSAGNAVQTNVVAHLIDPWPKHARIRNIAFDGERMRGAVERYRKNEVTDPRTPSGSRGSSSAGASGAGGGAGAAPVGESR